MASKVIHAYYDDDEMYLISSNSSNVAPKVSLTAPFDGAQFIEFDTIPIAAIASDLNDTVASVSFYANNQLIGTDNQAPFNLDFITAHGNFDLTAVATDNYGGTDTSGLVNIVVLYTIEM